MRYLRLSIIFGRWDFYDVECTYRNHTYIYLLTCFIVSNKNRRKKRYVHAIPIEHAKPHHLPVNIEIPSSTVYTDKISDAQDFQRLIELQDDEVCF